MIPPSPLKQPFYEHFGQEKILSRLWQMWFAVVTDQVVDLSAPPMQQKVVSDGVMAKPWQAWFQELGTLLAISEGPFREPLLNNDLVSEPWGKWFALVASA